MRTIVVRTLGKTARSEQIGQAEAAIGRMRDGRAPEGGIGPSGERRGRDRADAQS
jgi:hypothetical protein